MNADFPVALTYCDSHVIDGNDRILAGTAWWFDSDNPQAWAQRSIAPALTPTIDPARGELTYPRNDGVTFYPQWSPNGALIAFSSCCGLSQAWVVHPNGTGLRRVTRPVGGAIFWTPVWSPDSTKLLIDRQDRHNGRTSLWTVNTDGSGLSKLADTESLSFYAWGSAPAE